MFVRVAILTAPFSPPKRMSSSAPEGNLSPEVRQLVRMVSGWSAGEEKRLMRVAQVLESPADE